MYWKTKTKTINHFIYAFVSHTINGAGDEGTKNLICQRLISIFLFIDFAAGENTTISTGF
jgi:hypothetical protein